ncbi:PREDICTED: LOW QUALITY PROTEIN: uncharacterized protein KIAA1614 homolog [Condylura cristata]|uniref:LOW QUALITY PROTEIN: uncharacterized protein KIAA1614 homolog n=1 Tax=Condylura cristata TaxID=143302 RepID=UPI000642D924|nr:PREDICTED: LOW QUALITY PROTEIN: uncharacterized protein KIAA1614 homolog [Condylura cristata]
MNGHFPFVEISGISGAFIDSRLCGGKKKTTLEIGEVPTGREDGCVPRADGAAGTARTSPGARSVLVYTTGFPPRGARDEGWPGRDAGLARASPLRGMERMEAAAEPASGCPQELKTGSRATSSMKVISTVETSDPEPQLNNGHLPRSRPYSQEDRISNLMAPQAPGALKIQRQGPSVLECKVRALKEKMTAGRQGTGPCLTSHEWPSPKKPKGRKVKVDGAGTPSEPSSRPDAVVGPAQNLTYRKLNSSVNEEEPIANEGPRPHRPPASELECWNGRNLWPPEAVWTLSDHVRGPLPGLSYLQEDSIHRATACHRGDPGHCNEISYMPTLKKGRSDPPWDGMVTGGDLDSVSLTSEEDFMPRPALPGGLWRTGDLGALGTRGSTLSLSDLVEKNRLLLQEMLNVGGQGSTKLGIPAWTPSCDRAVPGRPVGDMSWDSGISMQDSMQDSSHDRTVVPRPEPVLNPRHEEAKQLLQCARLKARTRPLRANHDIVPTIARGSRDSRQSPAACRKLPVTCRDSLQRGSTSDSSSGASGSGQWLRQSTAPSHVRFEDESALEAESRYLERLQQRQRPGPDQGPLRSKPDLYDYIHGGCQRRNTPQQALSRLVGLDCWALPARGSERKCQACGHCLEDQLPTPGKAPPGPSVPWDAESSERSEGMLSEPLNSQGLSFPLMLPPSKQGLHVEWFQKTHIRDTSVGPEEVGPALDGTDTSNTCRTHSEEAGAARPSRTSDPTRESSPHPQASRPQAGPRRFWKADKEPPKSLQDPCYLPGSDPAEVAKEVKEGRGCPPVLPTDVLPESPEAKWVPLGSHWQPGSGLGNCWTYSVDTKSLGRTASAVKLESSGPDRQAQVIGRDAPLETVSLPQRPLESPASQQVQQPRPSPEVWVPAPPSSRKTISPASHRKASLAGPCGHPHQGESVDSPLPPSKSEVPWTCEPTLRQNEPCSPQGRHLLSTYSCHKSYCCTPRGPWEPQGVAMHKGKVEKKPRSQEREPPLEDCRAGGPQGVPASAAVGAVGFKGPILSVATEESESSQEPEGGLPDTDSHSRGPVTSPASLEVCAGPSLPSAAPSDQSTKSRGSLTSTLGLKKFFSTLSQGTRSRLAKCRSYSVEQLRPPLSGLASHTSTPKVKKAPSLQSLHLNLQSLLSGKTDRSSLYLVEEPEDDHAAGRPAPALFRRALSVEDVGAPSLARRVGRVVEVFPDGTSQLQLQCSPEGTFGFCVASGSGRRDSGFYVQEMADVNTAKLYSGLLGVGDEILEVNGAKVAGLGLAHIKELLAHAKSLSLRVLRQRPVPR